MSSSVGAPDDIENSTPVVVSDGSRVEPINGLSFVDDSKMDHDFRRLKGNQMYYVDRCSYYDGREDHAEFRILTLTPLAVFVVDFNGIMDRVTPYDKITEIYQKKAKDKKLLSFLTSENHLILKSPEQVDVHVSFPTPTALHKFTEILVKILEAHRRSTVTLRDIPPEREITAYYSDKRAEGYRTPREVAEIKRQRAILEECTDDGLRDVMALQSQLQEVEAQVAALNEEVNTLKQKGGDEATARGQKASVEHTQMQLHREVADKHEECERVLDKIKALQEELVAGGANEDALIEKEVAEMMSKSIKKHQDDIALRRRAQQKEKNVIEAEIATLKQDLSVAKSGESAERIKMKASLDSAYAEFEKELEVLFRLEKFFATVNGEVRVHNDRISAQNSEKFELINAREKKKNVLSPITSPTEKRGGVLDNLLLDDTPTAAVNDPLLGSPLSAAIQGAGEPISVDPLASPSAGDDLL
ncbi:uncharacterized protein TM35_000212490 [Trypanosoma theileri]|uniref:Uncharacterized protein n=1 Tax=Trypanosoma theileri TaxID=67003 RepID=A0A1X0NT55_9TRYP|nr:uncharacterized protein TM35_000212490 [Trypanosoma theileri]ORC87643.1 hypothetical protein TM35_000212490 [Trypanosoma theileri]